MRMIGHVTPTTTPSDVVRSASAPSMVHTNGECPWSSSHGWKWSEIDTKSNPLSSASWAMDSKRAGSCSSLDRVRPNFVDMGVPVPA
jgi:hypothetical protein